MARLGLGGDEPVLFQPGLGLVDAPGAGGLGLVEIEQAGPDLGDEMSFLTAAAESATAS